MTESGPPTPPFSDTEIAERLRAIPVTARAGDVIPDVDTAWAMVEAKRSHRRERLPTPMSRMMMVGASLVVLLIVGVLLSNIGQRTPPTQSAQQYRTVPGQRMTVHLADGSTLSLAPATVATVSSHTVDVDGEVYLGVAARASRTFVVRTRTAVVQVLGTTFGVRQYENESASRIVVSDGKVVVRVRKPTSQSTESQTPAVLTPNMLAQVTDSGVRVTSGISTREYTSWTHGLLTFNRVPLRDVVMELSRAYDVDIRIADSILADKPMILEVSVAQQPLGQVLDFIGLAMDSHYVQDGRTYVLHTGRTTSIPRQQHPERERFPQPEKQYGR